MINSELGHVTTLEEFNNEIRRQQEEAHGADYCQIHTAIKKYMVDCESYMELGVHQGGTASAALLCKPSRMQLVDIDLSRYTKFLRPIAEKFAAENNIELTLRECDSRSWQAVYPCDMLVIDSVHKAQFMKQELSTHAQNTSKYIIAHDTHMLFGKFDDQLYRALVEFTLTNPDWEVIERGTTNVGYTVLKKK